MTTLPEYPLAQVLSVKKKRVDEAEREVAEKKKILEREEEKLRQAEEERDKVRAHYRDKLAQLRQALDEGERTDKIQQMRVYLQVVEEKVAAEDDKVRRQKLEVDQAEVNLNNAKEVWKQRMKEVDKIEEHRKIWTREAKLELERAEAKEQDEIGSIIFLANKKKYS